MKYSELISFNPIEDVIQLTTADNADKAREYVKTYVMSDAMAESLQAPVIDQLQMDEVIDNKGVLVVGNYGTGKSHLMSVISSIAHDADNLQYLQNKKFAESMKQIAGKFEVLRIEIGGVTMSLREILFGFIQDDFDERGISFDVPDFNTVKDNKKLIRDMMMAFSEKYPDKGYLIVVDEFLSYLTSRDEREIVLDLEFFRALGEMCSKSKLRVIFGVQEKIFDNPRFSFVSDTLKHVSDRFTQIIITKEAGDLGRNIYRLDLKTKKRTLLDNGRGCHSAQLSADGRYLIDTWQEPTVPRACAVTDTKTGKQSLLRTAKDPWDGWYQPIFEQGTILAADGQTTLYWRMVKPMDFDASKKYPTVVYVYGGPHAHNVEASWHWGSRSWETYMAQKGYILFILDNRGSEDRGRDFEQVTFRHLGQEEMKDQMQGVAYLKSLPYVDADRLGVHGWSFGGFMTTSLMTTYPDAFKVGVAGGPVIDWKWYEVMYGERYMDTPQQNPEGYEQTSCINKAKNLKGKLQIIIGMNDPTCVPQHSLQFLNACAEAGTQPDFFVYPGEGHNMAGHKSVHLHERITQYFEDYLKPLSNP